MQTLARMSVVVGLLVLLCPPLAHAREESEAKALTRQLAALRKAGDANALVDAMPAVPQAYRSAGNPAEMAKLRSELGKIAKQRKLGPARPAAVRALASLGAPKEAWTEISSLMPAARVEEASALDLEVVKTAGKLAQGKVVKPLMALVAQAKDPQLAVVAAEALAGFRTAPKTRLVVLKGVLALGTRMATAAATSSDAASGAAPRWAMVGPAIVRGLNGLTGQELGSFEEWKAAYERDGSAPEKLFVAGAE
jgi:hypothetical protein